MARILVVDDAAPARQMISFACKQSGHEIHEAIDAPTALIAFAKVRPDLLVLDMNMPGGGGEFVLKMLRMGGDEVPCPILVVTGALDGTKEEIQRRLHVARVVLKPFGIAEIQTAVRESLATAPKAPPS